MLRYVMLCTDRAGLSRIERMNWVLNQNDTKVEIIGLRLRDVHRCHVALRQLDAREVAVNKYIVLDLSTDAALQSVLKQVRPRSLNDQSDVRPAVEEVYYISRES